MTYQEQSAGYAAFKVQSGLGTISSGSGATVLRQTGGTGLDLSKAAIENNEIRSDGMRSRGRHGSQDVKGNWAAQLSIDSHKAIVEAVMRDTIDGSALALSESDFTSLAISSNVITLGSGDPRTLGLRVGDVIRLTNMSNSANNNKNLRIIGLTSTTITIASGDTLTDQTADTSCNITRPKKLIQSGTLVKRYFTLEEYFTNIDQSVVAQDFVWSNIKFSMGADGIIMADPGGIGTGNMSVKASGSSPYFSSPTLGTSLPLAVVDATIRVNGTDVVDLTGFDLTLDIGATAPKVLGPNKYSPDVFSGQMAVSMNLTALRKDLQYLSDFIAETQYSLHVLAVENESEPKDFFSIYVGNFTLGGVQRAALNKQGGAMTETLQIPAALVGKDDTGTGYDGTMVKIQSTGF
jgi:hypothetical protein